MAMGSRRRLALGNRSGPSALRGRRPPGSRGAPFGSRRGATAGILRAPPASRSRCNVAARLSSRSWSGLPLSSRSPSAVLGALSPSGHFLWGLRFLLISSVGANGTGAYSSSLPAAGSKKRRKRLLKQVFSCCRLSESCSRACRRPEPVR